MVEWRDARRNNCMPGVMMDDDDEDDNDGDDDYVFSSRIPSVRLYSRVDLGTLNYYCRPWLFLKLFACFTCFSTV